MLPLLMKVAAEHTCPFMRAVMHCSMHDSYVAVPLASLSRIIEFFRGDIISTLSSHMCPLSLQDFAVVSDMVVVTVVVVLVVVVQEVVVRVDVDEVDLVVVAVLAAEIGTAVGSVGLTACSGDGSLLHCEHPMHDRFQMHFWAHISLLLSHQLKHGPPIVVAAAFVVDATSFSSEVDGSSVPSISEPCRTILRLHVQPISSVTPVGTIVWTAHPFVLLTSKPAQSSFFLQNVSHFAALRVLG